MSIKREPGSRLAGMNHWLVWILAGMGGVLLYASLTNN